MRNRTHGRPKHRMPHGGNAHDRRTIRRRAAQQREYEYMEDRRDEERRFEALDDVTLGDQDDTVTSTHDDTHDAWHRVLDALGALLVFLHLTRRHTNDDSTQYYCPKCLNKVDEPGKCYRCYL